MLILLLSSLLGCFSEIDYARGFTEADCEKKLECYTDEARSFLEYSDVEGCLEYEAETIEQRAAEKEAEDCAFDRKAARDCVDGTYALTCDEYLVNDFPESCDATCGG